MDYTNENGPELTDDDVNSIVASLGMPFDQGIDERIPVVTLRIDLFLTETKNQSIISASEVRDFLLDLRIELNK